VHHAGARNALSNQSLKINLVSTRSYRRIGAGAIALRSEQSDAVIVLT
jgi:hypothetical protein